MYYTALLGRPVDHSISPALFEILTKDLAEGYAHIKVETKDEQTLQRFIRDLRDLGFAGANITLPYKITAMEFVDELDDSTIKIGALNTIVFKDGESIGYNTDAIGAMNAIEHKLRRIKSEDQIVVIGGGGAARAVIYEIYKRSQNITILNINLEQAQRVSNDLSSSEKQIGVVSLNDSNLEEQIRRADFIINATPVGMYPKNEEEIVSTMVFDKLGDLNDKYFFDVIFNPYKTQFLQLAEKHGATICSGLYMMIYQAVAALKLWVDRDYREIDTEKIASQLQECL